MTASVPKSSPRPCGCLKALDLKFEMEEAPVGGAGCRRHLGNPYPEATQTRPPGRCHPARRRRRPQWDSLPREQRPERGLLGIRKELNLFANLRPAILSGTGQRVDLKPEIVAGLDILIVRELTGDIYLASPAASARRGERVGFNTMVMRVEIRRIGRVAFEAAPGSATSASVRWTR